MDYEPSYHSIKNEHMQNDLDLSDLQYDCVILATTHPHNNYTNIHRPPIETSDQRKF